MPLINWAKDLNRVNTPIEFDNTINETEILATLSEAKVREKHRKIHRKARESLATNEFVVKLKNSAQWQRWNVELKSTLSSIIRVK